MRWQWIIASLALASCATPRAVTTVTPKPDVTPVRTSNRAIREHVSAIRKSNAEAIKTNQSIGDDIKSADDELKKLIDGRN